jgi:hypothetical protein
MWRLNRRRLAQCLLSYTMFNTGERSHGERWHICGIANTLTDSNVDTGEVLFWGILRGVFRGYPVESYIRDAKQVWMRERETLYALLCVFMQHALVLGAGWDHGYPTRHAGASISTSISTFWVLWCSLYAYRIYIICLHCCVDIQIYIYMMNHTLFCLLLNSSLLVCLLGRLR